METKRPFLFFLPAATLGFLPAMDPWRRPVGRQLDFFSVRKEAPRIVAVRKLGSLGLFFLFFQMLLNLQDPCVFLLPVGLPRVPAGLSMH